MIISPSGGGDLAVENINVDGAIASVYVRFLLKRDRDARLLRKWGGRGQKRDNSKDRGEREMHLVQSKAELVNRRDRFNSKAEKEGRGAAAVVTCLGEQDYLAYVSAWSRPVVSSTFHMHCAV
ncbi:9927_t:CDS:2 [Acaulospora colombiana]|uniref:9927_t:CDS:1 n=1 Tax=Acaulospora colombiana TaxID=27376 RepID=A0ACA9MHU5_9GLOM|nr:9927_t:CDS:2 [Acaulospora colombiana]